MQPSPRKVHVENWFGFGRSDARQNLRSFCRPLRDPHAAIAALAAEGTQAGSEIESVVTTSDGLPGQEGA